MCSVAVCAAAFVSLTPAVAAAQEAPERAPERGQANRGLQLGGRVGYAGGLGSVYSGLTVNDASNGAIPFIVDLGVRALPELYLGVYGQWAPVLLQTNPASCPDGFNCHAQQWRLGLEVDYHFLPRTSFDPYVGVGGGYEILHTTVSGTVLVPTPLGTAPGELNSSVVDRGWEFVSLTGGLDFRLGSAVGMGPFVTGTFARYNVREASRTITVAGNDMSVATPDVPHADHAVFIGRLRGSFNP